MKINIPEYAQTALDMLHACGYKAYIVGGCVRDALLGKTPNDYDICTDCTPQEMKKVFASYNAIETGIKHGTLTVLIGHDPIEITTFRSDGKYSDHRKPDKVRFEKELSQDLKRRDFTINALCYNQSEGLVDMFGGTQDLQRRIIRCVGDPTERFDEDALRILRAMRFSSVLDFEIEKGTSSAIHSQKELLKNISAERIAAELKKLLCGKDPARILTEYRDVMAVIIPQLEPCFDLKQNNPHHCYDVYTHICKSVNNISPDWVLRLTMLLHDIGKPLVHTTDSAGVDHFKTHQLKSAKLSREITGALKLDNRSRSRIYDLVLEHDTRIPPVKKSVRRLMSKYDDDFFDDYLRVRRADTLAQSGYMREQKLAELEAIGEVARQIRAEQLCLHISDLAVNGNDLIDLGYEGSSIGKALKMLLDAVIEERTDNEKDALVTYLKENFK
ncbi:CCA tRNA nucleotidyltransferase [Ruminococcus sp. FC2018]|uniref:CCA tRNA nucleotidyltransferase n=1 Tax=Ruminococcus sp. FC2018 TaxID=1410617 RepID=UPI00048D2A79|nr:CCA tRNA nucleotidyltransferase [Ruminococcus sp. FC2018]